MNKNPVKYKTLLLFLLLFCFVVNLYSKEEKPKPPSNFIVSNPSGNYGLFKWKVISGGAQIEAFKIYYAQGETEEIAEFQILKTVKRDSLQKDKDGYHFISIYIKNKGKYSFFVTAFNQFGESERSSIVFQNIGENSQRVIFTSNPDTVTYLGEYYLYDANAVATNGDLLKYELINGPDGMNINHTNGELKWMPNEKGTFNVIIKAISITHPDLYAIQPWYINVKNCTRHTSISGTVKYNDDENVESGIVKIYKQAGSQQNDPVLFSTIQLINSEFSIEVDEGVYLLKFESEKFITEWYENAYLLTEAKRIEVKCGDEKEIIAKVDKSIPVETFKVSGKVTRDSDGEPISSVIIHFIGRNSQTEEVKSKGTVSDEDGNYEIRLDGNFNYTASVTAVEKYLPQFYDKADNPSEATVIELNRNRENIDFALKEKPTFTNKISGIVKDSEGNKIAGINVIAFRIDPKPELLHRYISRSSVTDNSGLFKFENLETGKYILLVYAPKTRKIPGYYLLNDFVVKSWREATKIEVGEKTINDDILIKIPNLSISESGRGIISGIITQGETLMASSEIIKKGDPIAGAVVFALDQESNVRNFAFTDDLGRYEMRSMKAGKYKILADKVGYYSFNTDVELIEDNSTVNNNVELYTVIYSVTTEEPLEIELFPNPVSDILHIDNKEILSKLSISIFNTSGELINLNIYDTEDSQNGININVSKFNSGLYYLRINNGSIYGAYPFVISR